MALCVDLPREAMVASVNLALQAQRIRWLRARRFTFEGKEKLPGERLKLRAGMHAITTRAPWRDSDLSHWEGGERVIGNALAHLTQAGLASVRYQDVVGRLSSVLASQDVGGAVALAVRLLATRPRRWKGGRA